jgi:hypothetical protein
MSVTRGVIAADRNDNVDARRTLLQSGTIIVKIFIGSVRSIYVLFRFSLQMEGFKP